MLLLAGAVAIGSTVPVVTAGAATAATAAAAAAAATSIASVVGPWSSAVEVPGLAALNATGRAEVLSVSCGPAGECVAGGSYQDSALNLQGFVISEQNGTWGNAIEVPGLAALNVSGRAEVLSVSCGPAGGCAAGGYYYDSRDAQQGFVITEQDGTWGNAIEVPGLGSLSKGFAEVLSVSCGPRAAAPPGVLLRPARSAGIRGQRAERRLAQGHRVPRPGRPEHGVQGARRVAQVSSVSCDSAGDCAGRPVLPGPPGHSRRSWSASGTAPGARPSSRPASRRSTRAGRPGRRRCPAPRPATAGPEATTRMARRTDRVRGQRAKRHLAQGLKGTRPGGPDHGGFGRVSSVACTPAANCVASGNYSTGIGTGRVSWSAS